MSPTQKSVLISLADQANDAGVCWPGVGTMVKRTCLGERTVQKAIRALVEMKVVTVEERRGRSTLYTIKPAEYQQPEKADKTTPAPDAPPQERHPTPAGAAPRTVIEPSVEPSVEPYICSDLADATSSPPADSSIEGELVDQTEHDQDIVPGWTFARLLDPPEQDAESGTFIALPLRSDQSPPVHFVTDRDVLNLQETYRGIDVPDQCRLMLGWLVGNPGKRKMHAGIRKFITSWLGRAKAGNGTPYDQAAPGLTGYDKTSPDPRVKRERVREALRDVRNTNW